MRQLAVAVVTAIAGDLYAARPPSERVLRISEFHSPPVSVSIVSAGGKNTDVVIELRNRSVQNVVAVAVTVAGEDCKAKPGWPVLTYGREVGRSRSARARLHEPPIAPGTGAQLVVPSRMLDSLRRVSERTCGKSIPPEVQITHV